MNASGKILFSCSACGYRARIPDHYSGKEVHCPGCHAVQVANRVEDWISSGQTVAVQRLEVSAGGTAVASALRTGAPPRDHVSFTCTACKYTAKLGGEYVGKAIRCPSCQSPQLVTDPDAGPDLAMVARTSEISSASDASGSDDPDKILFTCSSCGYRARIHAKYAGQAVLCPGCNAVRLAESAKPPTDSAEPVLAMAPSAKSTTTPTPAEGQPQTGAMTRVGVQFVCGACGFQSRISPSCAGGQIYCPSCRTPQAVDWDGTGTATGRIRKAAAASAAGVVQAAPSPVSGAPVKDGDSGRLTPIGQPVLPELGSFLPNLDEVKPGSGPQRVIQPSESDATALDRVRPGNPASGPLPAAGSSGATGTKRTSPSTPPRSGAAGTASGVRSPGSTDSSPPGRVADPGNDVVIPRAVEDPLEHASGGSGPNARQGSRRILTPAHGTAAGQPAPVPATPRPLVARTPSPDPHPASVQAPDPTPRKGLGSGAIRSPNVVRTPVEPRVSHAASSKSAGGSHSWAALALVVLLFLGAALAAGWYQHQSKLARADADQAQQQLREQRTAVASLTKQLKDAQAAASRADAARSNAANELAQALAAQKSADDARGQAVIAQHSAEAARDQALAAEKAAKEALDKLKTAPTPAKTGAKAKGAGVAPVTSAPRPAVTTPSTTPAVPAPGPTAPAP